jgi:CubicO group peptidase (beta-lactamase class C family)
MKMLGSLLLSCAFAALTSAASYCPFLGPVFPAPRFLSTNSAFQSSIASLRDSLTHAFETGKSSHGPVEPNITYSIQVFSINEEQPLLDLHSRGNDLVGNKTLNGDSIYRIASVTKFITVYMLLIVGGDKVMSEPVTKYLPELAIRGYYDDMTVGSLAGYVAGVLSDGKYSLDRWRGVTKRLRRVQYGWHCRWCFEARVSRCIFHTRYR